MAHIESPSTPEQIDAAARKAAAARETYWFDVPATLAATTGVTKVGLIELRSGEELMATRRSGGDPIRLALELARESLRHINDKRLSTGDLSADEFWESEKRGMAALRTLVLAAYNKIHAPARDDVASFLGSQKISVG